MKTIKIVIDYKDKEDTKEFTIKHSNEITPKEALDFTIEFIKLQ